MQKDELISLVDKMCKELLLKIDQDQSATKEKLANYLIESAQVIMNNDENIASAEFNESLFYSTYKNIAENSLKSYSNTNTKVNELTQMYEKILLESNTQQINFSLLTNKFDEIKSHMKEELNKANEIIAKLTSQAKTLEEKSNIDPLTKVFNERALNTYLDKICSNKDISHSFSFLMLNVDDFKVINDKYGHLASDETLIFIANIFKKTLRDGDKIFRYGKEEFVLVLNRLNSDDSYKVAQRLLFLVMGNELIYEGEVLPVTLSAGITNYVKGDAPDDLISRADKALCTAKENGKNKIHMEIK